MSGGHFNHQQYAFEDIAQTIQHDIDTNDSTKKDQFGQDIGRHYSPKVIKRLKKAVKMFRQVGNMAHEIDWLLSGDSDEETFLKAWKEKRLDSGSGNSK